MSGISQCQTTTKHVQNVWDLLIYFRSLKLLYNIIFDWLFEKNGSNWNFSQDNKGINSIVKIM